MSLPVSVCVVKSKAEGDRAARVTTLPQSGGEETFQRVLRYEKWVVPGRTSDIASARARRRSACREAADELELFRIRCGDGPFEVSRLARHARHAAHAGRLIPRVYVRDPSDGSRRRACAAAAHIYDAAHVRLATVSSILIAHCGVTLG